MAQQPNEDKKPDFSNLPRGAIGIKGLPVSRNARLPSIRSPRDLMLGAQPKRTFVPNIPVRREKRSPVIDKDRPAKSESVEKTEIKHQPAYNDRGRGRGRGRGQIIQTQGFMFGEGLAVDAVRKDRPPRESIPRGRAPRVKQEKMEAGVSHISEEMNNLLRDDFIDDDDDNSKDVLKPILFPLQDAFKSEEKKVIKKEILNFGKENIAKEMGYDISQVAKFIKKEKDIDDEEIPKVSDVPQNPVSKLFINGQPQLVLLQFPQCVTAKQKNDELDSDRHPKPQANTENSPSTDQKTNTSLSALPEGHIGKFQILKSGKARLICGSLSFDLDSVNPLCSKHEVVSVKTNSNAGDIAVLGNMEYKMKFVPDVEHLLSF